jgi:hypothetical protein
MPKINLLALAFASVVTLVAMLAPRPKGRDPLFAYLVRSYWLVYLGIAFALASRPQLASASDSTVLALHGINLAVAVIVSSVVARAARHVDDASAQRSAEKLAMQELQSAMLQLRRDAAGWPAAPGEVDTAIASMLDAIRFAPSRVPMEAEPLVSSALAMVESTGERTRSAEGQPAEWYLAQVRACETFVNEQLAGVQAQLSSQRPA